MKRLMLGALIFGCVSAAAGDDVLPSDISVTLTAEPHVNLLSGQRIQFTIAATNHGPEPVNGLPIRSSPIYDELDVFTASADCNNNIVLSVVDLEDSFYFTFSWFAARPESPLGVGETRSCVLNLDFTPWAPAVFPVTFALLAFDDLDPSNNSATVTLERAVAGAPAAVPTMSVASLLLLAAVLVALACHHGMRRLAVSPATGVRTGVAHRSEKKRV